MAADDRPSWKWGGEGLEFGSRYKKTVGYVGVWRWLAGTVYAMSKAAISQLGKNLACEWAKHGIRVNTVAPWFTYTPLNAMYLDKPEFRYRPYPTSSI